MGRLLNFLLNDKNIEGIKGNYSEVEIKLKRIIDKMTNETHFSI